jgi:putative DNA methylase
MEERRTFIERYLPVEEISKEAKSEKNGRAATFEMHYWWTRKPLITARAAVLGALLPPDFNIDEFKRLLGLGKGTRAHNYDLPVEIINKLRDVYRPIWGESPVVLDPFGGGGSIPFEAMRVGVDAISNDYNPVAYLIQKATLEYPKSYGEKLYNEVEKGLIFIFNETRREMERYYPSHDNKIPSAYIWCWMVRCPSCGFMAPLVGQWWLAKTENKKIYMDPYIERVVYLN